MPEILLINPLSLAHAELRDYFAEALASFGVEVTPIGEMLPRTSSPNVLQLLKSFFTRPDSWRRVGSAWSRKPKLYLFVDPFMVVDVLCSLVTRAPIIVFVHERRVYGRSLSSRIKAAIYKFLLARCIRIGPAEENRVDLLFGRPDDHVGDRQDNEILCFGNWFASKILPETAADLQRLSAKGFHLVRMGVTEDKSLLDAFDNVLDRYATQAEKTAAFRRARYLYLPYTPTNQSGVLIDCLNFGLRVVLGHARLPQGYVLQEIAIDIDEAGTEAPFDFRAARDRLHAGNLVTLRSLVEHVQMVAKVK
jgi:hypothetical protein